MEENIAYKKYIKFAFYINMVGIVLTFAFKGNIGVFGTLLIILAIILAVIGVIKKKQYEKKNLK
jgi:hypothetical protein